MAFYSSKTPAEVILNGQKFLVRQWDVKTTSAPNIWGYPPDRYSREDIAVEMVLTLVNDGPVDFHQLVSPLEGQARRPQATSEILPKNALSTGQALDFLDGVLEHAVLDENKEWALK